MGLVSWLIQTRLQFAVDDIMNEGHVVYHREMCAFPDVHLQARIGEASPTQRMFARYIGIALRRETRDRDFPWRFAHELVVARHLKFGAHDRQHQLPQLGIIEELLRRLDVEMANKLAEDVVGLK